ncbi:Uncharacterised protein [Bordetella pertussis]|nr:Uncharacterised protein [Bordetella pertussis]
MAAICSSGVPRVRARLSAWKASCRAASWGSVACSANSWQARPSSSSRTW